MQICTKNKKYLKYDTELGRSEFGQTSEHEGVETDWTKLEKLTEWRLKGQLKLLTDKNTGEFQLNTPNVSFVFVRFQKSVSHQ